jgi:hypothetical protein
MRAQNDRSKAADIFVSSAFALVLCLYHSGARGRNSTKKKTRSALDFVSWELMERWRSCCASCPTLRHLNFMKSFNF